MLELNKLSRFRDVDVYIGTYGDKCIAATGHSPYFCFEADSLPELGAKIGRLSRFVEKAIVHLTELKGRDETKSFVLKKTVKLKELEDA